jgi:hypothetical protein
MAVASDASIATHQSLPGSRPEVRKQRVRFAAYADRAASDVCNDYVRLARRFADDFVRDHAHLLK